MIQIKETLNDKKYQYLILFFTVSILYCKTILFDFNLDDYIITDTLSDKINSYSDLLNVFKLTYNKTDYRPIVFLSFGLEQLIFGAIYPSISHGVNLILYCLICILGLKLFQLLFDKKYQHILFFAVLLFAVHPINTEVVCSIKCRDNLLSMLFGLLSTIYFLKFLKKNQQWYFIILAILFSLAAILSKKDAMGFWLFIFGILLFNLSKRNFKLVLIGIASIISIIIIENSIKTNLVISNPENEFKGMVTLTENPLALDFSIENRIVSFTNTIYYYFTKLTYISPSKYYYGYNYYDILSLKSVSFLGGILLIISFLSVLVYSIINKNKILSITILGIATLSFYALNFWVPVAGIIADRYIFLASLFFCLLVVYLIYIFTDKLNLQKYFILITFCLVCIYSLLSFKRASAWKDQKTLIDTDAPKLFSSYEAMRIASSTYFKEYTEESNENIKNENYQKSIFYGKKAIAVYPKNYLMYLFLGQYYFEAKDFGNAISYFKTSLQNDSTKADASIYLGDLYYSLNTLDSALFYYNKAFSIDSTSNLTVNNISTVYYEMNDKQNCLKFNTELIERNTFLFAPYENLGYYYLEEKDTSKAKSYFELAVKNGLNPLGIPSFIR